MFALLASFDTRTSYVVQVNACNKIIQIFEIPKKCDFFLKYLCMSKNVSNFAENQEAECLVREVSDS